MKLMPWLVAAMLVLLAAPCAASGREPGKITVFAAASLKESLDALGARWKQRGGQEVVIAYAASSALAKQIEQRAPADVFISADREWMDFLQARGLVVASSRFELAGNRLVVVAPATSRLATLSLASPQPMRAALGRDGRLAVAETVAVPAGRYAREALEQRGLWRAVETRLAQADNVRAAMAFVARGEAPLGIVYFTDARAEPNVRVVATFDPRDHDPIVYPAARVSGSRAVQADKFLAFLRSREARGVLRQAGFTMP